MPVIIFGRLICRLASLKLTNGLLAPKSPVILFYPTLYRCATTARALFTVPISVLRNLIIANIHLEGLWLHVFSPICFHIWDFESFLSAVQDILDLFDQSIILFINLGIFLDGVLDEEFDVS